ncbi:MAG: hypothetical protein Q8T09_02260 [Candidatus Melainabacteria bacterium]|nr:hypothetical protein [Candidatus Melainabacteria bacterium]
MTDGVQEPGDEASKKVEPSELSVDTPQESGSAPIADLSSEPVPEPVGETVSEAQSTTPCANVELEAEAAAKVLEGAALRRSPWLSSIAAIQYVGQASATDDIQVRTSDRVTVIALLTCCIAEVLSLVYTPMAGMRLAFIAISDVVLAVAITMFLVYRLGILSSLGKRQALICWQLMMGCIFLGIFLCVNVAAGVALGVSAMYPAELP